jgi:hypothetical protein
MKSPDSQNLSRKAQRAGDSGAANIMTDFFKKGDSMKKNNIIKKCRITVFMLLCIHSWLLSSTITIKQDGSGDFTTIQPGIDVSADGDTVLVHPGIYYENLNMNGKNITLASLELTTGNPQYINQTLIDGQNQLSCIEIQDIAVGVTIQGFTIQNGYGTDIMQGEGGGLFVQCVEYLLLKNCIITHNNASAGGGACFVLSNVVLSGVHVFNNNAGMAGGLFFWYNTSIQFSQDNLCSIYNNNAGKGTDLYNRDSGEVHVNVDTFSVDNPDSFFAQTEDDASFNFSIQHAWMDLVAHDLYVAPDGDNANSGLSADEPLQTIAWAMRRVDADSLHPRTIHVAAGEYSHELNNQLFPIGFKPYTSIIGEDMESTILTNDSGACGFFSSHNEGDICFENFTVHNNYVHDTQGVVYIYKTDFVKAKNITIENCHNCYNTFSNAFVHNEYDNLRILNNVCLGVTSGLSLDRNSGFLINSVVSNNTSTLSYPNGADIAFKLSADDDFLVRDCVFSDNYYDDIDGHIVCTTNCNENEPVITFENCLFANNVTESSAIFYSYNIYGKTLFNNCTFTNNTAGWFTIYAMGDITMRNTIMDNNVFYEIMMEDDTLYNLIHELDVDYCNIRNGEAGIANNHGVNTIIWGAHNIEDDPGFLLTGEHPYQLAAGSPCIDAGTPDTTGLFLPPWDLLQNHRVWDGNGNGQARVDMGCYEYGAGPWVYAQPPVVPAGEYVVCNYPNPFKPSAGRGPATVISFSVPDAGEVELVIYNMRGQKVRTLMKCYSAPGSYKAQWDGRDGDHQPVASGVYFAQLITPQRTTAHKMMMLK